MCTYVTEQRPAEGSGKAGGRWFPLTTSTAYYDHPVSAQAEHTLNLDFANPGRGAGERVAVELTTESALGVVDAIVSVLAQVPEDLSGVDPQAMVRVRDTLADAHRAPVPQV